MKPAKLICFFLGDIAARLAQERVYKQAAAHTDAPVDSPNSEIDTQFFERFAPGKNVLVNTINQCAIKIEEESGQHRIICNLRRFYTAWSSFHGVITVSAQAALIATWV